MVLKATLQKESPKQSLPKVSIEAAVRRCSSDVPYGLQLYLKEASTQVFSCEYCENFTKSFFYRKPLVASVNLLFLKVH